MSNKATTLGKTLAYGLAALICIGAGVGVGRMIPFGKSQVAAQKVAAAASRHGLAPTNGISVHGWWTIQVVQQGRVVQQRQFENSLVAGEGDKALAGLLGRQFVASMWTVTANNVTSVSQQLLGSWSSDQANTSVTPNLTGSTVNGVAPNHLLLSGSFTAAQTNTINEVETWVQYCGHTVSIDNCTNPPGILEFTSASLGGTNEPADVPVQTGQQVKVTVDLSFS